MMKSFRQGLSDLFGVLVFFFFSRAGLVWSGLVWSGAYIEAYVFGVDTTLDTNERRWRLRCTPRRVWMNCHELNYLQNVPSG